MDDLLRLVYDLVNGVHIDKVKALSKKIKLSQSSNLQELKGFFATDSSNNILNSLIDLWMRSPVSSEELASLLIGASYAITTREEHEVTELVWSGPDTHLFPVRRSEQVLLDLIRSANESLFVVSFVLVNIPTIEQEIINAIDRGVKVKMLLESEDKDFSNTFVKTLERLNAQIPNIELYIWPRKNRGKNLLGFARVHAKCAVADMRTAFVTSANLTESAFDRNIEMGVYISGGTIPRDIYNQLNSMISIKEIVPYSQH